MCKFKQDIERYLENVDVKSAVFQIFDYINNLDQDVLSLFINSGSMIGQIIDKKIPVFLTKNSKFKWRNGAEKLEVDAVCLDDNFFNTEVKTTGQKEQGKNKTQYIKGSKTQSCINGDGGIRISKYNEDNYGFYIFVGYHKPNKSESQQLTINRIYMGMLKPSDWHTSFSDHDGSSSVYSWVFNDQFICIYESDKIKKGTC